MTFPSDKPTLSHHGKQLNFAQTKLGERYRYILTAFKTVNAEQDVVDQAIADQIDEYLLDPDITFKGREFIKHITGEWHKKRQTNLIIKTFATPINPVIFGLFGLTISSATTLHFFLERWAEFSRTLYIFSFAKFELLEDYGVVTITPDEDVIKNSLYTIIAQGGVSGFLSNLRSVTRQDVNPDKITLAKGCSEQNAKDIAEIAHCPVEIADEIETKIYFTSQRVHMLLPAGDSHASLAYYELAAKRMQDIVSDNFSYRVKHWLIDNILNADYSKADIAHDFGLTLEFINKKLQESGTDFTKIKLEVLPNIARYLLQLQDIQIKEIGFKLGYTSSSSFNKAFNRWLHMSPADYRKFYLYRLNHAQFLIH